MEEYNKVKKPILHSTFVKNSPENKVAIVFCKPRNRKKKKSYNNRKYLIILYIVWNEVTSHHNVSIWQTLTNLRREGVRHGR